MFQRYLPTTLVLGRTRDLTLRRIRARSEREVRAKLATGAALVERLLARHVVRTTGRLPDRWLSDVDRKQIQGNGHSLPDLVSYAYQGTEVLAVWTYVENDVMHILVRRSKAPVSRIHQPFGTTGWAPVSWSVGGTGV